MQNKDNQPCSETNSGSTVPGCYCSELLDDSLFGKHYGPLSPSKWIFHEEPTERLIAGDETHIAPVTVHLVSTLRCNHACYFCTYGGATGNGTEYRGGTAVSDRSILRISKKDMDFELMIRVLAELAEVGTKGVIFTGGGEPTLYPHLAASMEECSRLGMNWSLNTNGRNLTNEFVNRIMPLNPTYIRVSLNAGSRQVQRLVTGVDDYDQIIANIECLLRAKHTHSASTDVSIGFVVNVLNVFDIMGIVRDIIKVEKSLIAQGVSESVYSIQFRPVGNYESSKKYSPWRIREIEGYLRDTQGATAADEFSRFMFEGEQCSSNVLKKALQILEGEATEYVLKHRSQIRLVYPERKFSDLPSVRQKTYQKCRVLPWFLFIWPDGTVYPCVEWAGTPGFEIGNIAENSLHKFLFDGPRTAKIDKINREVVHSRCAPICAHHEMNIGLDRLCSKVNRYDQASVNLAVQECRSHAACPPHVNFL